MTYLDDVILQAKRWDKSRPRSKQVRAGWSDVGGCQAALQKKIRGEWPTDTPDVARAITGSVWHDWWEARMAEAHPGRLYEVTTEYRGIPGHADEVDQDEATVTDLKTTTLKASARLRKVRPAQRAEHPYWRGKLIQVNGYAAGLIATGELPPEGVTVRLLFVPVDGRFTDWWVHESPFDWGLADEGADRHDRIASASEDLPCSENLAFCSGWCEYFSVRPNDPADPF